MLKIYTLTFFIFSLCGFLDNEDFTTIHSKYNFDSYIVFNRDSVDYHEWNFCHVVINLKSKGCSYSYKIKSEDLLYSCLECVYSYVNCEEISKKIPAYKKDFQRDLTFLVEESRKLGYFSYTYN